MKHYDLNQFPYETPPVVEPEQSPERAARLYQIIAFLLTFFLMFATWILLSGRFDLFHLALGVFSSALVAYFSRDLLFSSGILPDFRGLSVRFAVYIPWLMWQILLANLHVLKLALSPGVKENLDPHIIRIRSRLKTDLSLVTYANSITLTPGTITVFASQDGEVTVHAIDRQSGDPESLRIMEEKVARTFGEMS